MNNVAKLAGIILFGLISTKVTFADSHTDIIKQAVNNPARSESDRKRDETSKPVEVLSFFGVKPGMKVLDFLSGGGYYSEILSYVVGDKGEVVAHTNEAYRKFVGEAIKTRFGNNRLPKINQLSSEVPALGLGVEKFDMILMVMTYHDVYYVAEYWPEVDRDNFFTQIHSALKTGGTLAIIDHSAKPNTGSSAAQDLHRIDEVFARKDIESAGFSFEASSDVLRNPNDDRTMQVFDEAIRRKTDRFVYRFVKN
jgi:predicted methyltransferase